MDKINIYISYNIFTENVLTLKHYLNNRGVQVNLIVFDKFNKLDVPDIKQYYITDIYYLINKPLQDNLIKAFGEEKINMDMKKTELAYKDILYNPIIIFPYFYMNDKNKNNEFKNIQTNNFNIINDVLNSKYFINTKRIFYNTEHLNKKVVCDNFKNSCALQCTKIIDFCADNIDIIYHDMKRASRLSSFPLNLSNYAIPSERTEKNILFFGYLSNRRNTIINNINLFFKYYDYSYKIDVVDNIFNINDIDNLFRKYKILLNIKNDDGNFLETHRINKAILNGCYVVSESKKLPPYSNFFNDHNILTVKKNNYYNICQSQDFYDELGDSAEYEYFINDLISFPYKFNDKYIDGFFINKNDIELTLNEKYLIYNLIYSVMMSTNKIIVKNYEYIYNRIEKSNNDLIDYIIN